MKKFVLLFIPLLALTSCGNNPIDNFVLSLKEKFPNGYQGFEYYNYIKNASYFNLSTNESKIVNLTANIYNKEGFGYFDYSILSGDLISLESNSFSYKDNVLTSKENIVFKFKDGVNYFEFTKVNDSNEIVEQISAKYSLQSNSNALKFSLGFFSNFLDTRYDDLGFIDESLVEYYENLNLTYKEPKTVIIHSDSKIHDNANILYLNNDQYILNYKSKFSNLTYFYFDDELKVTKAESTKNGEYYLLDENNSYLENKRNAVTKETLEVTNAFEVTI